MEGPDWDLGAARAIVCDPRAGAQTRLHEMRVRSMELRSPALCR